MTQTVLILGGSGKIGSHTAEAFWNAGWNVRHYDRALGDMTAAAQGVDVIVNGLNPPNYNDWAKNIPAITTQVIAAAKANRSTVIIPGNIYNYGDQPGTLDENTPHLATTRKGQIRVEMEAAYRAAGVQTIVLRAGNFIDPNGNGDIMSLLIMRAVKAGKITTPSDPKTRQAYAYVPDWARAAQMLAERRTTLTQFEDVPFPGHSFTLNELRNMLHAKTGKRFKFSAFPWWIMRMLSPFIEVTRELLEMRYLYEMDHTIGTAKFNALLPEFVPTPIEHVMLAGLPAQVHPDKSVNASRQTVIAK